MERMRKERAEQKRKEMIEKQSKDFNAHIARLKHARQYKNAGVRPY